ncbi:MAG: hypothetical protein UX13_C0015G0016 [Candidatus Woesebacteria bacterium GW2011_GWB1_45_5]|uniref:Uncharacterized protein n=1 Tax=Candidatus Woesebacteria bacterium GW2011_GWB1_45_5 TaxID=1618581 RepID=A0A0G1MQB7_9BACT|nr:MAG: hypothetical protein UX13_C0015G0016 [Candidatus Woesebacteria bacterium GW2011_GWB1_45_5]
MYNGSMVTVILPGYSSKNKDWAMEAAREVKMDHEVRPILWDHWQDPDKKFDAKEKADDVVDILLDERVNIIAKSIGTLVASYMIEKITERIDKVVFCGIPLNGLTEDKKQDMRNALKSFPHDKIICFQNQEDPQGSFDAVKKFISEVSPDIKVVSKPREDHEYPYYPEFQVFLKNF